MGYSFNCYLLGCVSLLKSKLFSEVFHHSYKLPNYNSRSHCSPIFPPKKVEPDICLQTSSKSLGSSFPEGRHIKNVNLLFPALFGTGAAYLISFKLNSLRRDFPKAPAHSGQKLLILAYVFISISGIAMFICQNLISSYAKDPLNSFITIGIGLVSATLLFAAVDLMMYILFPGSFTGQLGEIWLEKAISFIYYSALSISVGPVGDIVPRENTTRLLLAMEGMTNLTIFSLMIASIFR